jgi:hypothetical protein
VGGLILLPWPERAAAPFLPDARTNGATGIQDERIQTGQTVGGKSFGILFHQLVEDLLCIQDFKDSVSVKGRSLGNVDTHPRGFRLPVIWWGDVFSRMRDKDRGQEEVPSKEVKEGTRRLGSTSIGQAYNRKDPQSGYDLFSISFFLEGSAGLQEPLVDSTPGLGLTHRKGVNRPKGNLEKPVSF